VVGVGVAGGVVGVGDRLVGAVDEPPEVGVEDVELTDTDGEGDTGVGALGAGVLVWAEAEGEGEGARKVVAGATTGLVATTPTIVGVELTTGAGRISR
jgi:hypothetical protein